MSKTKPMNLPTVACCATCTHIRGSRYVAWCSTYRIRVLPHTKCDDGYERSPILPQWVLCAPIEELKG